MIFIYRLLFFPVLFFLLPYYLLRMRRRGGYRAHFCHRFGWVPRATKATSPVWIQAVSVGELEALHPLFIALQQKNIPVYLTTTTSTAFRILEKKYRKIVDGFGYFPLDFWCFSACAWKRIQPRAILLMESELWPEHLFQAAKRSVPVYLINGRCSDKTFSRYRLCLPLARSIFGFLTKIFSVSAIDTQRFQQLCPPSVPIVEVGNIKIDAALQNFQTDTSEISRKELGENWPSARILLGASTWSGEEKMLIELFQKAKKDFPYLRLILVPRHAERTKGLRSLLQSYSVSFCFRTNFTPNPEIYVVNTTGELRAFLPMADFVFIGKSMPPHHGGQTPIEAAACGKPIVYGTHMENFSEICNHLESLHGAVRCAHKKDLERTIFHWLQHPEIANAYGQAAQQWLQTHQGATQRIFNALRC